MADYQLDDRLVELGKLVPLMNQLTDENSVRIKAVEDKLSMLGVGIMVVVHIEPPQGDENGWGIAYRRTGKSGGWGIYYVELRPGSGSVYTRATEASRVVRAKIVTGIPQLLDQLVDNARTFIKNQDG